MYTLRFGRKLKLPSTVAIKHQIRKLMAQDQIKKEQAEQCRPTSAIPAAVVVTA
jgi:hypothetical protein